MSDFPKCNIVHASPQDVDAQEEPRRDLRTPLQGGRDGGQEGHPPPQAPRDRRAQPTSHESPQCKQNLY